MIVKLPLLVISLLLDKSSSVVMVTSLPPVITPSLVTFTEPIVTPASLVNVLLLDIVISPLLLVTDNPSLPYSSDANTILPALSTARF